LLCARRIQADLTAESVDHDIKTVRDSMAGQGLIAKAAKRFNVTADRDHELRHRAEPTGSQFYRGQT